MKRIVILIALLTLGTLLSFPGGSGVWNTISAQDVTITPLDNNTSSDDFAPSPSNHGRILVISTDESGAQKLYSMERTSSGWSSTRKVSGDVNDGGQVGSAAMPSDGQTMIFAAYDHDVQGMGRTDLYSATKSGGSWVNVKNLGGSVNSSYYDSQPTITADGRTIYFVSDRPGGKGGTDI